jgi:arylsulfatase A-like enzyme
MTRCRRLRLPPVFVAAGLLAAAALAAPAATPARPNVLFIAVDDLNDGTTLFAPDNPIRTPQLERLARRGAFFSRAYCASPACNPSRATVLTGRRPHRSGVYGNASDWRRALPGVSTLPRLFKDHGYFVGGAGKIFHHHLDWAFHDNASFHEYLMLAINEPYPERKLNSFAWFGSRNTDWGRWPADVRDTADFRTTEYAIRFLGRAHAQPFFLAVGIYKPHSPFFAPAEFFADYPLDRLRLPERPADDLADLPAGAQALFQLTSRGTGSGRGFWNGLVRARAENPRVHEEFVQAYQACATFADTMIGRVLDALDRSPHRDRTIVVLWSDHGFHLGEKDHIEKFALWEKTTHVPFLLVAPGVTRPGQVIGQPVDLSAIYPTLAELCGLPLPGPCDGISLVPRLRDPAAPLPPALMTYLKGNHAVRSERWRYIRYADGTEELYDHDSDPQEWRNLAGEPAHAAILAEHRRWIPADDAAPAPDLRAAGR